MKKILIADDSEYHRARLKAMLSTEYSIVEADTGDKSREAYKREKPDLVLLDIVMPEGDEEGLQVLRDLKKMDPDVRVIMVSAVGANRVIHECEALGVGEYIEKPFNKDQVLRLIDKHLK